MAHLEPDEQRATELRLQAQDNIRYIADNSGYELLQHSFLALPAVQKTLYSGSSP
jgi:hypothetical protein